MPTLDEDQVVIDAINQQSQLNLTITGRAATGTSGGAIYVDLGNGEPGVVTRFLGPLAHAHQTASILELAHRRGLPVPRHHQVVPIGQDIFVVQERLPGEPPTLITTATIDAVVEVNDLFAGVVAGRDDVRTMPLCLRESGDPYPRHEILAEHSSRSRRILGLIQAIGRRHPGEVTGDDLLHVDLDLSNILFNEQGEVTGIVDWNLGAYRGDRYLALVKTRFEQEWALHEPSPDPNRIAAAQHLDEVLRQRVTASDLQLYWAHRILYQLHWMLPSGPPEVVDWHLAVAEDRLL